MRNLLALAAFLVLVFAGIGWYRGWYKVATEPSTPGHQSVNIDFNRDKIVEDSAQSVKKVEEKLQKVLKQDSPTDGTSPTADLKGSISLSPPKPADQAPKDSSKSNGPILP